MRSDELYLRDILVAANDIREFVDATDLQQFQQDRMMRRAVLQALIEIGEAANHVSEDVKSRYPQVPWDDARAFRNFAVHRYFSIVWEVVWDTAKSDVGRLRPEIETILSVEFPEDHT